jgi:hypothetical protein
MQRTLYQERLQREREQRAARAARLLDSARAVLAKADADGERDLLPHEVRQVHALVSRAEKLAER